MSITENIYLGVKNGFFVSIAKKVSFFYLTNTIIAEVLLRN